MRAVTKEQFFETVGNIAHPTPGPERTVWRHEKTEVAVGYTYPGWLCTNVTGQYQGETTYFLTEGGE